MKETVEHNNRFYGEELKTESEQLKEWLVVANKEIERLNNRIDKAIDYLNNNICYIGEKISIKPYTDLKNLLEILKGE